eukprot:377694-Rhodomonas_salina.3
MVLAPPLSEQLRRFEGGFEVPLPTYAPKSNTETRFPRANWPYLGPRFLPTSHKAIALTLAYSDPFSRSKLGPTYPKAPEWARLLFSVPSCLLLPTSFLGGVRY